MSLAAPEPPRALATDKAFVKGLRLLEALASSEQPRGITELAAELQLTKSNVHRLLTTLQAHGFVNRVASSSRYELTTKLWRLGTSMIGRNTLIRAARPAMHRLADLTRETVHLSILEDAHVVYIDKIDGSHHVRAHTRIGSRAPAFTVASGKAMLAHLPPDYIGHFRPLLKRYTDTTRTTLEQIRQDVDIARQQGFAMVLHGEWRVGIAACACAVLGGAGNLEGAIGISGPDTRLKRKDLKAYAAHVVDAARDVGAALGHRPDNT